MGGFKRETKRSPPILFVFISFLRSTNSTAFPASFLNVLTFWGSPSYLLGDLLSVSFHWREGMETEPTVLVVFWRSPLLGVYNPNERQTHFSRCRHDMATGATLANGRVLSTQPPRSTQRVRVKMTWSFGGVIARLTCFFVFFHRGAHGQGLQIASSLARERFGRERLDLVQERDIFRVMLTPYSSTPVSE